MATSLGINNPNSRYNRSRRTAHLDDLLKASKKSSAMFTITAYAWKIYPRYEAVLHGLDGATGFSAALADKFDRLACEYEAQLTLLAKYADDMEKAGIS